MRKIFVIDTMPTGRYLLNRLLTKQGFDIIEFETCEECLSLLSEVAEAHVAIVDLNQGGLDSKTIVNIRQLALQVPTIICSTTTEIKVVVMLMKLGIYDFLGKPVNADELVRSIHRIEEKSPITNNTAVEVLSKKVNQKKTSEKTYIEGESASYKLIVNQILRVAPTSYSVIIYGETGSGKEMIAQEIHRQSLRKQMPFVAIDCGAISKELAGSELFGHEKGSFTGAHAQKIGSFELANGGTIFLDEIANLPYEVQVSLLRVVQERKLRRLGGTKDIALDIRIIVASNDLLWDETRKVKISFREDLYHRFNEFTIKVPALRDRKEDIKLFAKYFLDYANNELGKNIIDFRNEVYNIFLTYPWYGNLRELKNVIKRAALLSDGDYVELMELPQELSLINNINSLNAKFAPYPSSSFEIGILPNNNDFISLKDSDSTPSIKSVSLQAEYQLILKVMQDVQFNKVKAAKVLNIDRKTLYNKLEEFSSNKMPISS